MTTPVRSPTYADRVMLAVAMLTLDNTGAVRSGATLSSDAILQQACETTWLFEGVVTASEEHERFNVIIRGLRVLERNMYVTGSEYQWFVTPRVVLQLQNFVVAFEGFPTTVDLYRTWMAALARAFPSRRRFYLQTQNKFLLDENARLRGIVAEIRAHKAGFKAEIEELHERFMQEFSSMSDLLPL